MMTDTLVLTNIEAEPLTRAAEMNGWLSESNILGTARGENMAGLVDAGLFEHIPAEPGRHFAHYRLTDIGVALAAELAGGELASDDSVWVRSWPQAEPWGDGSWGLYWWRSLGEGRFAVVTRTLYLAQDGDGGTAPAGRTDYQIMANPHQPGTAEWTQSVYERGAHGQLTDDQISATAAESVPANDSEWAWAWEKGNAERWAI
jgi:hypothetical protein